MKNIALIFLIIYISSLIHMDMDVFVTLMVRVCAVWVTSRGRGGKERAHVKLHTELNACGYGSSCNVDERLCA